MGPSLFSVGEVEVVVRVVIVFTLAQACEDKVKGGWNKRNLEESAVHVIINVSFAEIVAESTVEHVEEPLLGSIRPMMPDVATCIRLFLIEIELTVPCSPLLFGNTKAFSVGQAHVACVTAVVRDRSSSLNVHVSSLQ